MSTKKDYRKLFNLKSNSQQHLLFKIVEDIGLYRIIQRHVETVKE